MSVFDVLGEDHTCGWPSPGMQRRCTRVFGHNGRCFTTDAYGRVTGTWPGPGNSR